MSEEGAVKSEQRQGHDDVFLVMKVSSTTSSITKCACIFYRSHAGLFLKPSHHPSLSSSLQPRFVSLKLLALFKVTIAVERMKICECDGHTIHKFSQRRLPAD